MNDAKPLNIWRVPRDFDGEDVVIVAGGPSVTQEQIDYICGKAKVIAINDAYRLVPWADVLYGADAKWWRWHYENTKDFEGTKVCLRYNIGSDKIDTGWPDDLYPELNALAFDGREGVSIEPGVIRCGKDSGYQAIQLAIQLGAKRIILIGYDMKSGRVDLNREQAMAVLAEVLPEDYPELKCEAIAFRMGNIEMPHWFGEHPDGIVPPYARMLPMYETMAPELEAHGIQIINCTPDSALRCFWEADLKDTI